MTANDRIRLGSALCRTPAIRRAGCGERGDGCDIPGIRLHSRHGLLDIVAPQAPVNSEFAG